MPSLARANSATARRANGRTSRLMLSPGSGAGSNVGDSRQWRADMDWWLWLLIGLACLRFAGDILSLAVMAAAVFGAASTPYNPDDLGG